MRKWIVCVLLGAFITGAMPEPYERILVETQTGAHIQLSPQIKKEFLNQKLIKELIAVYRKSVRKTGHPASSPRGSVMQSIYKMYSDHLMDLAVHAERAQLNRLVRETYNKPRASVEEEEVHMKILGKLYDGYMFETIEAYKKGDTDRAAAFGSLGLFVITEVYIRLALFDLGYRNQQTTWESITSVLRTPDRSERLLRAFWRESAENPQGNLEFHLVPLEKMSGKGMAELVPEYQKIVGKDQCTDLLSTRTQLPEEGGSDEKEPDITL